MIDGVATRLRKGAAWLSTTGRASVCRSLRLFPAHRQILSIECVHENLEIQKFKSGQPVVAGVAAQGLIEDRSLSTHGAKKPIVLQRIEGPKIEVVPGPWLVFDNRADIGSDPVFAVLFAGSKFRLP